MWLKEWREINRRQALIERNEERKRELRGNTDGDRVCSLGEKSVLEIF